MKDRTGAGLGGVGVDIGEAGLDVRDAMRVRRGLRLSQEGGAFPVGLKHVVHHRGGARRRFLLHRAHPGAGLHAHLPVIGRGVAQDQAEQGRLAGAVAPHQSHAGPGRHVERRAVEEDPAFDPVGEVVDVQHGDAPSTASHRLKAPL